MPSNGWPNHRSRQNISSGISRRACISATSSKTARVGWITVSWLEFRKVRPPEPVKKLHRQLADIFGNHRGQRDRKVPRSPRLEMDFSRTDPIDARIARLCRHQTIRPSTHSVRSSAYRLRPPCLSANTIVGPEVSGSHTRRSNCKCSRDKAVALLSVSRVAMFQRRGARCRSGSTGGTRRLHRTRPATSVRRRRPSVPVRSTAMGARRHQRTTGRVHVRNRRFRSLRQLRPHNSSSSSSKSEGTREATPKAAMRPVLEST